MDTQKLHHLTETYLQKLCSLDRSVGSEGNRLATRFFADEMAALGWQVDSQAFDAIDWETGGADLLVAGQDFAVFPSPYSLGVEAQGTLVAVSSLEALCRADLSGKIVLLHGEIAREQIMPKNFVFYNPEEHQQIVARLEQTPPLALVCATGRNAALAGGVYPFPLFEDGDFDIPSVYMTEEEGARLMPLAGQTAAVRSISRRIPGKGYNVSANVGRDVFPTGVVGRENIPTYDRIVITAHIDAKKGTPGAIDNATGVVILMLLGHLLKDSAAGVEIVAFNGEDYYAVPGQMLWLQTNQERFETIRLNINIDGAGYREGQSAYSLYGLPEEMEARTRAVFARFAGIVEGAQWQQGDHSMFIQFGRPAIALSSAWFTDNVDSQEITHTPKDRLEIVDCAKVVEIAQALAELIIDI